MTVLNIIIVLFLIMLAYQVGKANGAYDSYKEISKQNIELLELLRKQNNLSGELNSDSKNMLGLLKKIISLNDELIKQLTHR